MSCVAVACGVGAACAVAGLGMSIAQTVKQDKANDASIKFAKLDGDGVIDWGKSGGAISDKDGDGKADPIPTK